MKTILLVLALMGPGPADPFPAGKVQFSPPQLLRRGEPVAGTLQHAEQGMGLSPNWVQFTVGGNCEVIRWECWTAEPVIGLDQLLLVEFSDSWFSVSSWWGERLRVRVTVDTPRGRKTLETVVVFDLPPS